MKRSFDNVRAHLATVGLNLVGTATIAAYDARVPAALALAPHAPDAYGVVVIGNGGRAFWDAFRAAPRGGVDPLDAFTRGAVTDALGPLEPGERLFWPFVDAEPRVSFVDLAECAGLGSRSRIGVLLHPHFGPWIALRAALAVADPWLAPRPADGFDPCPSCTERPCIAACPGGAVGEAGWDVARCAAHRLATEPDACALGCHARVACVYGREHVPPPEALAFHQAAARAAMRAAGRRGSGG